MPELPVTAWGGEILESTKNTIQKTNSWCGILGNIRFQIRYSPERIRRAVALAVWRTKCLCAVNVNWNDDGWDVNANSVENPNRWNDSNQVFSRNYLFSPVFVAGVFKT